MRTPKTLTRAGLIPSHDTLEAFCLCLENMSLIEYEDNELISLVEEISKP